jgi:ABC-type multidrug transport system fused ATPase/permease subunit
MAVVAHRLATVQSADVIFVLENGGDGARVLEMGSHAELVASNEIIIRVVIYAQHRID